MSFKIALRFTQGLFGLLLLGGNLNCAGVFFDVPYPPQ